MQKIQPLHKSIEFLTHQTVDTLPMHILKLYDDEGLVRVFLFRLVSTGIVVERLILN